MDDAVPRRLLGWREWVALPELGIPAVKAKVDTGAKTSALHVMDIDVDSRRGEDWVRFHVHPDVEGEITIACDARLVEWRSIKDSSGRATTRPIIHTLLHVGGEEHIIEVSLTRRAEMGFRMLLGREALRGRFTVDPALSFVAREAFTARSLRPWDAPARPGPDG